MTYENVLFSVGGGIARLTLNRPEKLNSFNAAMHDEVRDAIARVSVESGVRVLLLTGAGRAFCAGQDLADAPPAAPGQAADLGAVVEYYYAPLVQSLRALPLPVVCAVNGVAAGAGANLALCCDLVIAKRSAVFIQSFARLGLLPDTGGTHVLARRVGTARAMGLALLGDKLKAERAAAWGLIWECVEDHAFEAAVEALLQRLATAPTLGLARTKQAIYASESNTFDTQLQLECDGMRELGRSQDYNEGVSAFIEKRTPVFHGR